ncbi:hypothetical protein Q3G72_013093 [Acer saccharum]|nr:hypothetical protein Q3G72_013093 [Acer saccharum]
MSLIWTAVAGARYSIEHIRTKWAAVFPIIMKLLTAFCVPYVLARVVFPVLGSAGGPRAAINNIIKSKSAQKQFRSASPGGPRADPQLKSKEEYLLKPDQRRRRTPPA